MQPSACFVELCFFRKPSTFGLDQSLKYQNLVLLPREWELAEFQLHFLAPFHHATTLLQSTPRLSLHKTFEMYENLFDSIENLHSIISEEILLRAHSAYSNKL